MNRIIEIGNIRAGANTMERGELFAGKFANGVEVKIPTVVANGAHEGPIMWLNCVIHGDEICGLFAVQDLLKELDLSTLHGAIIATLISNPLAYQDRTKLSPQDGGNLCDAFPGKEFGKPTERMAYALFEDIKKYADFLIDYHSWGQYHDAKPYAVFKMCEDPKVSQMTEDITMAFNSPLVCKLDITKPLSEPAPVGGAMDVNCQKVGIPSFMAEVGHAGWGEPEWNVVAKEGTLNILRYLKMIPGEYVKAEKQIVLTAREIIKCNTTGLCVMEAKPQQLVKKGERICKIVNVYGDVLEEVLAPRDIYPISLRYEPTVNVGDRVAFVGSV